MPRVRRFPLRDEQQKILEKWSRGGSTPYRLVKRSQIVLLAAQGISNRAIARRLRINPITAARWRSRFLLLGTDGIRWEAPRLGSPPPVSSDLVRKILEKTLFEAPPHRSRWSTRSLGRAVGVSHSTVRRIWKARGVRPPQSRVGRLTRDSRFRPRSIDVVGVYLNPPQRAVAISLRESGRQAPGGIAGQGAPLRPRTTAPARSWMVDLVTTLTLLDQTEIRGSAHRLLDQEFLSFLHTVHERRQGPEHIELLAESADPKPPVSLDRWLQRHPEFSAHVAVGHEPLRQIVVEWFGDAFARPSAGTPPASLPGLRSAVERWVQETGTDPRPFAWTRK